MPVLGCQCQVVCCSFKYQFATIRFQVPGCLCQFVNIMFHLSGCEIYVESIMFDASGCGYSTASIKLVFLMHLLKLQVSGQMYWVATIRLQLSGSEH